TLFSSVTATISLRWRISRFTVHEHSSSKRCKQSILTMHKRSVTIAANYERFEIPRWEVRNQTRSDTRPKASAHRKHCPNADQTERGHRQCFNEAASRTLSPRRLDRSPGRKSST